MMYEVHTGFRTLEEAEQKLQELANRPTQYKIVQIVHRHFRGEVLCYVIQKTENKHGH